MLDAVLTCYICMFVSSSLATGVFQACSKYTKETIVVNTPAHGSTPEVVVYMEIASGNRMLMKGVTTIKPKWLAQLVPALCTFGKPLEQPPPRYDPKTDTLKCFIGGSFGQRYGWALPVQELPYPEADTNRCVLALLQCCKRIGLSDLKGPWRIDLPALVSAALSFVFWCGRLPEMCVTSSFSYTVYRLSGRLVSVCRYYVTCRLHGR